MDLWARLNLGAFNPTISTFDTDRQKQLRAWQMRIASYRHHFNETQGINNT